MEYLRNESGSVHVINAEEKHLLLRAGCIAVAPNVQQRRQVISDGLNTIEIELPAEVLDQPVPIVGYNVIMSFRRSA